MSDIQKQIDEAIGEGQRLIAEIDNQLKRVESLKYYRLDFYADNIDFRNKRFSFKVSSEDKALKLLGLFVDNGTFIRACYLNLFERFGRKDILLNSVRLRIDDFLKHHFS